MSETSDKFIPTWFWGIIVLQVLIVSFFALSTLFNPPPDFNYTTMAYITRNLTTVLAIILAVWLRSREAFDLSEISCSDGCRTFDHSSRDWHGLFVEKHEAYLDKKPPLHRQGRFILTDEGTTIPLRLAGA